ISIIGVPSDYGQRRRGVDMGPSAIRYADIIERLTTLGYEVVDEGDIQFKRGNQVIEQNNKLLNLNEIIEVSNHLANKVQDVIDSDSFPLVLGGDHSIAIGTLAGLGKYYKNLGVIWYDAHADLNTPDTTPSGNIHGMPLAVSLGRGNDKLTMINGYTPKIKPENVIIIGA
ncbi:arginase, partial [Butyricicoccus sp. 1XD8-22]